MQRGQKHASPRSIAVPGTRRDQPHPKPLRTVDICNPSSKVDAHSCQGQTQKCTRIETNDPPPRAPPKQKPHANLRTSQQMR
jgi:hypothetical protein